MSFLTKYKVYFLNIFYVCFIAVISLASWGLFGFRRGYHAEQGFYIRSLQTKGIDSFFYGDISRPFMSTLYHLGYLITDGSFHGLNLMFGLTVSLTGVLTVLIVKQLGVNSIPILLLLFALTMLNGADQSTNVPSMIIVRQSVLAALGALSISLYLINKSDFSKLRTLFSLLIISSLQIFALWSYEASIGLILGSLLFLSYYGRHSQNYLNIVVTYVLSTLFFLFFNFLRYFIGGSASYQSSKFFVPEISEVFARYKIFLVSIALPYRWMQHWDTYIVDCKNSFYLFALPMALIICLISLFLLFQVFTHKIYTYNSNPNMVSNPGILILLVILGLAYLPYIFLIDGGGSWRTHFYSIPIFSILTILLFFKSFVTKTFFSNIVKLVISFYILMILFFGTLSSLASQLEMTYRWDRNQTFTNSILSEYPNIRDHSLIIVFDQPLDSANTICNLSNPVDIFGQDYWLTAALKTVYPFTDIRGVYFDKSGDSKTTSEVIFEDGFIGFKDSPKRYGLQDIIFIKWNDGNYEIVNDIRKIPYFLDSQIYFSEYSPSKLRIAEYAYPQVVANFRIKSWVLS